MKKITREQYTILCSTPLFTGLTETEVEVVLQRVPFQIRRYTKGESIYTPESFRKELGLILTGRILVTRNAGELVVSELNTGGIFGAAALFNDEERYVTTLKARSACTILFLDQDVMLHLMDLDSRVRLNYIRYLSERIRFLSHKIDSLVPSSGTRKLQTYLLEHMDPEGHITPEHTMSELAARLNMGRATLYRELDKLEDQGYILRKGKSIVVLNPDFPRN